MINKIRLQPLIDFTSNKVFAYEALYTKGHEDSYPEATAMLNSIFSYRKYNANLQLFINMTPHDAINSNFASVFLEILDDLHLNGSNITLEISENTNRDHLSIIQKNIKKLKNNGVKLAMDDWGVDGDLSFLKKISVDIVKVDKKFVQESLHDKSLRRSLQKSVRGFHDNGWKVVAEGIETLDILRMTQDIQADMGQGFVFSATPAAVKKQKLSPFVKLEQFAEDMCSSFHALYC